MFYLLKCYVYYYDGTILIKIEYETSEMRLVSFYADEIVMKFRLLIMLVSITNAK